MAIKINLKINQKQASISPYRKKKKKKNNGGCGQMKKIK